MFDFRQSPAPPTPVLGVHAGIGATYFQTQVPLDTQPLDYTPEEK